MISTTMSPCTVFAISRRPRSQVATFHRSEARVRAIISTTISVQTSLAAVELGPPTELGPPQIIHNSVNSSPIRTNQVPTRPAGPRAGITTIGRGQTTRFRGVTWTSAVDNVKYQQRLTLPDHVPTSFRDGAPGDANFDRGRRSRRLQQIATVISVLVSRKTDQN